MGANTTFKLAQCIYINVAETGGTPEAQYTK